MFLISFAEHSLNATFSENPNQIPIFKEFVEHYCDEWSFVLFCKAYLKEIENNDFKPPTRGNRPKPDKLSPYSKIICECIHKKCCSSIECFGFGVLNKSHDRYRITKSTLSKALKKFLGVQDIAVKSDYKYETTSWVFAYQISMLSKYSSKLDIETACALPILLSDLTLQVNHLCGCSSCCNPEHLRFGSSSQNHRDLHIHKQRDTYCVDLETHKIFADLFQKSATNLIDRLLIM